MSDGYETFGDGYECAIAYMCDTLKQYLIVAKERKWETIPIAAIGNAIKIFESTVPVARGIGKSGKEKKDE